MSTKITPKALIEMGFEEIIERYNCDTIKSYNYDRYGIEIDVYLIPELLVELSLGVGWKQTNATTIEDIKDLIRLFK